MQNSNLKRADEIECGQFIQLPKPLKVIGIGGFGRTKVFSLDFDNKILAEYSEVRMDNERLLMVVDNEPEEMDKLEIYDRLESLLSECRNLDEVIEQLMTKEIINIQALTEATNYLEPAYFLKPKEAVRACRICHCTDDDCSQCIEATGEPCSWVEEDLCSRCAVPPMENPAWKLEGNEWVYHKELDETPCDDLESKIDAANAEMRSDIDSNLKKLLG